MLNCLLRKYRLHVVSLPFLFLSLLRENAQTQTEAQTEATSFL